MKKIDRLVKMWQQHQEEVAELLEQREAELVRLSGSADRLKDLQAKLTEGHTRVERVYQVLQDALRKRRQGQPDETEEEEEPIPF